MSRPHHLAGLCHGPEGALALVDDRARLVELAPMPVLANGRAGRAEVDPVALASLLRRWRPREVLLDRVQWAPPRGRAAWHRGRGAAEGVVAALGVPSGLVTDADLEDSAVRLGAIHAWPGLAETFALGPASLARAAMLARAGLRDRGVLRPGAAPTMRSRRAATWSPPVYVALDEGERAALTAAAADVADRAPWWDRMAAMDLLGRMARGTPPTEKLVARVQAAAEALRGVAG